MSLKESFFFQSMYYSNFFTLLCNDVSVFFMETSILENMGVAYKLGVLEHTALSETF